MKPDRLKLSQACTAAYLEAKAKGRFRTRLEVAQAAGVSHKTVTKCFSIGTDPDASFYRNQLESVLRVLNVSPEGLL